MGFGRKTPKPPPERRLPIVKVAHTHYYYDGDTRKEERCMCATGQTHTTPKSTKVVEGPDKKDKKDKK